ncbi:MAG: hypothetical protein H0V66_01525 [Bdellovibrionales bacterium]|nr:hypothetical protein [Bdellovibrionales bacterium]
MNKPKQFLEFVQAELDKKEVGSLDEMNQQVSIIIEKFNSLPVAPFLGLSPTQMSNILYRPLSFENDVFTFECQNINKFKEVPLFRHSMFLLNKLKNEGEIKATQIGNLPRALVREMYNEFFFEERYARLPNNEDDVLGITMVKHVLEISGLMKKRTGKFSLTKKGENLLVKDGQAQIFNEVILTFLNEWNWAYGDGYPEFYQIQRSVVFNLYLLHKKCQDWVSDKEIGQFYLNAFPTLVQEAKWPFSPEDEVINCFSIRFLNRVCLPLGLLEAKEEVVEKGKRIEYYRVTRFFKESFGFKETV